MNLKNVIIASSMFARCYAADLEVFPYNKIVEVQVQNLLLERKRVTDEFCEQVIVLTEQLFSVTQLLIQYKDENGKLKQAAKGGDAADRAIAEAIEHKNSLLEQIGDLNSRLFQAEKRAKGAEVEVSRFEVAFEERNIHASNLSLVVRTLEADLANDEMRDITDGQLSKLHDDYREPLFKARKSIAQLNQRAQLVPALQSRIRTLEGDLVTVRGRETSLKNELSRVKDEFRERDIHASNLLRAVRTLEADLATVRGRETSLKDEMHRLRVEQEKNGQRLQPVSQQVNTATPQGQNAQRPSSQALPVSQQVNTAIPQGQNGQRPSSQALPVSQQVNTATPQGQNAQRPSSQALPVSQQVNTATPQGQNAQRPSSQALPVSQQVNTAIPQGQNGQRPSSQALPVSQQVNIATPQGQNGQRPSSQALPVSQQVNTATPQGQNGQRLSSQALPVSQQVNTATPQGQNGQRLQPASGVVSLKKHFHY